ncbi:MAG: hypothetical protein IKH27_08985 [Oscillospiraceae bacterium]|nr:hypothetical protein [Oscillospiraceae bacterium]
MKHKSILRMLTACVLSCTLCCTGMTVPAVSAEETELPACFDWREEAPEIITPVKAQIGNTCWAYSTIACAEANLIKKGLADSSLDLSESHLIWFTECQGSPTDPDDPRYGGGHNEGIEGYRDTGSVKAAVNALAAWQGVIPESDAASHADMQPLEESLRYQSIAHLQNSEIYPPDEPQTVKEKLMENGPMILMYYNSHDDPISAQHGYYNADYAERKEQDTLNGMLHDVVIVGWDDSFAKENFTDQPPADGAWMIRDSQSARIKNENEYFFMSYFEPSIQMFYRLDFEPVTNYGNVHHYNGSDLTTLFASNEKNGMYMANVFQAEKEETITAVGFFTNLPSESCQISVYALDADFTDPQDGTLIEQFDWCAEYGGFHTVSLPQHFAAGAGQRYSVVIRLPIGKQYYVYKDSACRKKGVSFYAVYGETKMREWKDCFDKGYGDVCIHVYTEYEGEPEDYIPGDLNRDGLVNAADLSLLKQVLSGSTRDDLCLPAADWNGDGERNAADARQLLRYLTARPEA